jgi:hypothetical protein
MLPQVQSQTDAQERLLVSLTREIAIDMLPLEDILKAHGVTPEQFETLTKSPRYRELLVAQTAAWASAHNVEERIRLKTQHMLEMSLPEMFERLHDRTEGLTGAKVELFKALQKGSGVGLQAEGGGAEKVQITINMGAAEPVRVEAVLPGQVIDHAEDV